MKQQALAPKKVYCIDNGILSTVGFKTSLDFGKMIENVVAVELLRRIVEKKLELYYWKDYQQREVDFVIKLRGRGKNRHKKSSICSIVEVVDYR